MTKVNDYQKYADFYMDRHARDYYNIGAGDMQTLHDNENAFARYSLISYLPQISREVTSGIQGNSVSIRQTFRTARRTQR